MARDAPFYSFSLERYVPADHLPRAINRFADLSSIREHLRPFYGETGRPTILSDDPDAGHRLLRRHSPGEAARGGLLVSPDDDEPEDTTVHMVRVFEVDIWAGAKRLKEEPGVQDVRVKRKHRGLAEITSDTDG